MPNSLRSARHKALCAFLIEMRRRSGMTQADVAKKLGRYQSYIANVEGAQRRVDVVEFLELAEAIGFDPAKALKLVARSKRD